MAVGQHFFFGQYLMAIGRFIFVSNCKSGTACRICGLLLVLQRFSTGKHRSLPPGIPFTVVLMLDVHYSRNAKEISDLCVCQLTPPHHHRLILPPSPPRSSSVVATFNLFNASPGLRGQVFCNLALELARFQSDHHSPEGLV